MRKKKKKQISTSEIIDNYLKSLESFSYDDDDYDDHYDDFDDYRPAKPKTYAKNLNMNKLYWLKRLKEYIVIDCETTGMNRENDRIIEIAILEVSDGNIVNEYSTLINPSIHVSSRISSINHIDDSMLQDAPKFEDVASTIKNMIMGKKVVAHNANFDVAFIINEFKRCDDPFVIEYIDSLSVARKALPSLENHKLETLISHFGLFDQQEHRALSDARVTFDIFLKCIEIMKEEEKQERENKKIQKRIEEEERRKKYMYSPLYGKVFVFTGEFKTPRYKLQEIAEEVGASPREKLLKSTDFLVVGDVREYPEWAIERKLLASNQLRKEGRNVTNITEKAFYRLVDGAKSAMKRKEKENIMYLKYFIK